MPQACKDCVSEAIARGDARLRSPRPAPHPGPRCYTHHLAFTEASRRAGHARGKEKQFGLPPGGYKAMLDYQEGRCGGCGRTPGRRARRLAVDHDHLCCPGNESCGQCVRGLLCYGCNDALRHFKDDPASLRRLASYLEDWPSRHTDYSAGGDDDNEGST